MPSPPAPARPGTRLPAATKPASAAAATPPVPPRLAEVAYAEVGGAELHGLTPTFQRLAREQAGSTKVALDLGCGEGRVAFLLSPLCKRVVAVDLDARKVEQAKSRARNLGLANIDFHTVDLEKENFARLVPGGAELAVANLFLSKTLVQRVHDALVPGGAFLFTGFGPRQWQEAGGSTHAHKEQDVRDWLRDAHLKTELLQVEDVRVRFKDLTEARSYLGEEKVKQWLKDGRWDRFVESFVTARGLTESRLTGLARR